MVTKKSLRASTTLLFALALVLAGCSDQIVYRDRDRNAFDDPPANAGEFLGYSNAETKRTTCGNCHSGKQAMWQQTAHAGAWKTLSDNPAARAECEACHSVSSMGNSVSNENVGYVSTRSARYRDVQCEACHGPGLTHVQNPDITGNKPLAAIAAGVTLGRGCAECHSGAHQPFAEDWAGSRHAKIPVTSRATSASCTGCHEGRAALQAWGVTSTFAEQGEAAAQPITCAVCHDPHDKRNPGQLRYSLDEPSLESNLCMKCHYKRAAPEVASTQGPHSPQGPLLLGDAGWVPPNFIYPPKSLVGSHGSDRNPRLCASCHVNNYEVTDEITGEFTFRSTGHSFQATPCVDGSGIPTGAPIASCDIAQRSFKACVSCHLTEGAARAALSVTRERLDRYAAEIEGMLPLLPASEFSITDNRISTAEGSRFNAQLARERGSPAHNPYLVEALLLASIRQIELDYGVTPDRVSSARARHARR